MIFIHMCLFPSEIEAVSLLVFLENLPDLFRGSLWLHLVKWSQVQRLQVSNGLAVWIRIQTLCWAFPGMAGWTLECQFLGCPSFAFLGSLLRALQQELGRREGSLADTLLALLIRVGGCTSEHRNGLCAVVPVSHAHLGATASDLGSVGECEP